MSARDELNRIINFSMEEPTERTKRASKANWAAPKKPVGTPVSPEKAKELFKKLVDDVKKISKNTKLSARQQLDQIINLDAATMIADKLGKVAWGKIGQGALRYGGMGAIGGAVIGGAQGAANGDIVGGAASGAVSGGMLGAAGGALHSAGAFKGLMGTEEQIAARAAKKAAAGKAGAAATAPVVTGAKPRTPDAAGGNWNTAAPAPNTAVADAMAASTAATARAKGIAAKHGVDSGIQYAPKTGIHNVGTTPTDVMDKPWNIANYKKMGPANQEYANRMHTQGLRSNQSGELSRNDLGILRKEQGFSSRLQSLIQLAAWTRKEGKSRSGGLNEKGRKSYERENPGSDLKAPSKEAGNPRRASFCARMSGMKKKLTSSKTANDPDSRINKSLKAWNCSAREELNTILFAKKGGDYKRHWSQKKTIKKKGKHHEPDKEPDMDSDDKKDVKYSAREELEVIQFGFGSWFTGAGKRLGSVAGDLAMPDALGSLGGQLAQGAKLATMGGVRGITSGLKAGAEDAGGTIKNLWGKLKPAKSAYAPGMNPFQNSMVHASARDQLNTILMGVDAHCKPHDIEFGIFSPGTAKRVFRGLAEGAERSPLVRPNVVGMGPAFIPRSAPSEATGAISSAYGTGIQAGSTVVPRATRMTPEAAADLAAMPAAHQKIMSDPIATAAHERGHAYDPNVEALTANQGRRADLFNQAAEHETVGVQKRIGGQLGAGMMAGEYSANKRVLDQVQKHGTGQEVDSWKKYANYQMKNGYRKPMFDSATSGRSLSEKKDFLRDNPYLRRSATALAEKSTPLFFNTSRTAARAQLDEILLGVDPRPRNPLGEFSGAEEGQPNPNHMKIVYAAPQEQAPPSITGKNMGKLAAGGAAFMGGGMALQHLIEKLKKLKK